MIRLTRLPVLVLAVALVGLAMLVPAIHAAATDDSPTARAFFYSGMVTVMAMGLIGIVTANRPPLATQHGQLLVLCAAYLVLPPVMAIPIVEAVRDTSFGNAWWEMLSAFTTTGATLYDVPGRLPPSVHLWRAIAGWIGGAFILVAAVAILAPMNLGGAEVLSGRASGHGAGAAPGADTADPAARIRRQVATVVPAYAGLTLVLWLVLMALGGAPMASAVHAMGTLSTSGILPGEGAFAAGGLGAEAAIALFLCLALSRRFLPGLPPSDRRAPVWRDGEVKLGLLIVGVVALVLAARHWLAAEAGGMATTGSPVAQTAVAVWGGLFGAISFLTTTGYPSSAWEMTRAWSGLDSPGLMLMGLAVFGGGVATTAGGVKLLRVYALFRHAERELERTIHPSSVGGRGDSGRRLRQEGASLAFIYFLIFALAIGVTMALLTLTGLSFQQALVLSIAALTSCGPLAQVAGEAPVAWSSLDPFQQVLTGLAMVMGRLELLAVVALMAPDGWRR